MKTAFDVIIKPVLTEKGYSGISEKAYMPDLGSNLTREQAAVILIKLFGKRKWFNKMWKHILDKKVNRLIKKGYLDTYYEDIF